MNNLVIEYVDEPTGSYSRYCRTVSKERTQLNNKILEYYKGTKTDTTKMQAQVFSSGINAIHTLFAVCYEKFRKEKEVCLIIGDELYCDTNRCCHNLVNLHDNFHFEKVNICDTGAILSLFERYKNVVKLFYFESCSNPSGQMFNFDPDLISKIKQLSPDCLIAVDNTWTTAYGFNPLEYGADVVVESMTKYISGSKCIGGLIVAEQNLMEEINRYVRIHGLFIGADHCKLFIDGLDTLEKRIKNVSDLGIKIASNMYSLIGKQDEKSSVRIAWVFYPTLKNHTSYLVAEKILKLNPGCILFCIEANTNFKSKNKVIDILSKNPFLAFETSYGSTTSRICPWFEFRRLDRYNKDKNNKKKGMWLRLSIGSESNEEDIMKGIKYILENLVI